jgi:hypothetical protein
MGGDSGQSQQKAITNSALGTEQQYLTMAQNSLAQGQNLIAPLEQYNTGIINSATSGDESALISAAGPQITNITKTANLAKESAYSSIPAGAGRDAALAQAKMSEGTNISTALNQLFQNALTSNATLGAATEAVGLQETGAGLNALGTASTSNQASMNAAEQSKSSTLSFLGQLASAGGKVGAAAV